jgi:energy-coupling factor transporter ATP-binding protein EcfA2
MKSLTRLRLINWHLFANEDIDIKNITFLTGANGTGKSTIIDAIQIVLLGDTSGHNFNKAANDRTGRTLRGYLRCETGETADGQVMCLRPGRFTSYIALQFFDDKTNKDFTLGIVFDSYEDDTEEHHFFYLASKFPENDFTNAHLLDKEQARPLTYKEFSKILADSYKPDEYQFFDSNIEYHEFLKHVLGDLPEKFFTLFKKAVGFSPITNISSFITEFVCDVDYNIDISPMQTNIEQYKLLELEAKKVQTKIDALTSIKEAYGEFAKVKENLVLADYVADKANYESDKADLDSYNQNLEKNKSRISEIDNLCRQYDEQMAELKEEKESYLAKKVGSAGYSLTASLSQKKQQSLEKIAALESNYASLSLTLSNYINSYKNALDKLYQRLTSEDLSFLSDEENDEIEQFKDQAKEFAATSADLASALTRKEADGTLVSEFQTELAAIHSSAIKVGHVLDNSVFALTGSRDALDREIQEIHAGHKPFDPDYLEVKAALEAALSERHPGAKVESYCDLVDIRDKRWTHAIEAYVFNQKFNFFVDEAYYEEAASLLSKICREYGFYQIAVVDTAKLIERGFSAKPGSVAEEILTNHEGAGVYTDFLMGNLMKCETFAEARASGNGLLPNCTGYRNFASFYLNERKGEVSYLGTKLDEETALKKKDDFSALNKKIEEYNDLNSYFHTISKLEVLSTSEAATFKADIEDMKRIEELNKEAERFDQEMKEGDLGEVAAYDQKISQIDEDIKNIQSEKDALLVEKGGLANQSATLEKDLIPNKRNVMDFMGKKLLEFDPKLVEEKFDPFFEKAAANLSMAKIKLEAQTLYVQTQDKLKSTRDKVIDLRSKYTVAYNLSYDTTKEANNDEFDNELTNLSSVLLPSYLIKIEEAHKKAIKEFKDDFIYKLRTSFETISAQIGELNEALKSVRFGRDSYRFSVEPNKDYLEYYNMITDDLLLNVGDAEDVYLEKYKDVMTSLFNLISEATDQEGDVKAQILENIAKFTDYRTYLIFDLLVRRGEEKAESSLARTFKRQSGGETQTPFYISILASFAQLYRSNEENSDTLRLVIFDEAFSKMDGSRIKESVDLLRSFGLQAILSTPSEKLRDLSKEVDLVLVTIHDVKKNRSYIDRYEDKEKKPQEEGQAS